MTGGGTRRISSPSVPVVNNSAAVRKCAWFLILALFAFLGFTHRPVTNMAGSAFDASPKSLGLGGALCPQTNSQMRTYYTVSTISLSLGQGQRERTQTKPSIHNNA
jgi:hypothetical protein